MVSKQDHFDPLPIRKRSVSDPSFSRYRVYRTPSESTVVEGRTAAEAFKLSGYDSACRIIREATLLHEIIKEQELSADAGFVNTDILLPEGSEVDGIFIHAPKETGAPVLPDEMLESVQPRFEEMTLAGLGRKKETIQEASQDATSMTAVSETPAEAVMSAPVQTATEPEEPALPDSEMAAAQNDFESAAPLEASPSVQHPSGELSEEEVKRLLGE